MSVGTIDSTTSGYSATFLTPGVRPTDPTGQFNQVQPVPPVNNQDQQAQTQATTPATQTVNTNPTDEQRTAALSAGKTRGSFVNISA